MKPELVKPEHEGVRAMKLMKLRLATGLGLLILMATMIGGAVRVSHAQDDQGGVTLASLAGKFAARGSGSLTLCFNTGFTALQDCASAPNLVPFNFARIEQETRDGGAQGDAPRSAEAGLLQLDRGLRLHARGKVQRSNSVPEEVPGQLFQQYRSSPDAD